MLADVLEHALDQLGGGDHAPMSAIVVRAELTEHADRSGRTRGAGVTPRRRSRRRLRRRGPRPRWRPRSVTRLEYSAHPTAQQTLAEVAAEIAAECDGRAGDRSQPPHRHAEIGDAALVAAVAADHRRAAFETCASLVDIGQGAATGVEAPDLRRRIRRVGRLGLGSRRAAGRGQRLEPVAAGGAPERRGEGRPARSGRWPASGTACPSRAGASPIIRASLPLMSWLWTACHRFFR